MKKALSSSLTGLLIIAAAGFGFYKLVYEPKVARALETGKQAVDAFLIKEVLVDPGLVTFKNEGKVLDITARMPARFDAASIKAVFERFRAGHRDYTLDFGGAKTDSTESVTVEMESPFSKVAKIRFIRDFRPKIAVILDDWGYSPKDLSYLSSIKQVFTASVLPGLKYSVKAAEEARRGGKGVMLHLPMQPSRKMPMEKDTILASMTRGEIIRIVDKSVSDVPYITGVNNHEGSLATENKAAMTAVMERLKDRGLFFIDSLTSAKTAAYRTAMELGVHSAKRNVFIDNKKKSDYNEAQINRLKAVAKARGYAIGIGHDDPVTLETLSRMMPDMEKEGFEFVLPAELLD